MVGGNGAVTAADGTFTLPNLTAGSSTVTASLTGYATVSQAVTIVAGSSTSLGTLQLTPISPGVITGVVINSAGTGIAGASVTSKGLTVSTDASGNYTFSNIPAGSDPITASATGFTSASETVTATAGATVTAPPLTLVSGSGTVTGTVKNSAGAAIAGASVGFGGGTAITSATGVYTLSSVPTGTVQLVASASGFQSVTQNVAVSAGATVTANFVLTPYHLKRRSYGQSDQRIQWRNSCGRNCELERRNNHNKQHWGLHAQQCYCWNPKNHGFSTGIPAQNLDCFSNFWRHNNLEHRHCDRRKNCR